MFCYVYFSSGKHKRGIRCVLVCEIWWDVSNMIVMVKKYSIGVFLSQESTVSMWGVCQRNKYLIFGRRRTSRPDSIDLPYFF